MSVEDILTIPPPAADARLVYGSGPHRFGDLRLPKTKPPFPVAMNIHGGFWRAKYDLGHAGHLCAALTAKGLATWNVEYRRVGNPGGGWPGTFEDIAAAWRFLPQIAEQYHLDTTCMLVIGHSAGGHLALCLAGHEASVKKLIALAGVVDLVEAWRLSLSNDAVVEFLGGTPEEVPENFRQADPMQLSAGQAQKWLIHGLQDDIVPPGFSRNYAERKKTQGERVHLLEIHGAGHFELIDPRSAVWAEVEKTVQQALGK
jgi:acetyl esterase/lipase